MLVLGWWRVDCPVLLRHLRVTGALQDVSGLLQSRVPRLPGIPWPLPVLLREVHLRATPTRRVHVTRWVSCRGAFYFLLVARISISRAESFYYQAHAWRAFLLSYSVFLVLLLRRSLPAGGLQLHGRVVTSAAHQFGYPRCRPRVAALHGAEHQQPSECRLFLSSYKD